MNLVLLPGLVTDHRLFRAQIDALAGIARVSVADLTRADSIPGLADAVIAAAPAGPLAIAGLSMGGYVALEIMRRHPQRVVGLALLDTSARPDTAQASEGRRQAIAQSEGDYPAVVSALVRKQLHPDHSRDAELVGRIQAMASDLGRAVFVRQQQAIMGRSDSRPHLAGIRVPTLVLCGREDVVTPPDLSEELKAGIAHARLAIVEDCGHLSPLEQPAAVSDALAGWLRQLDNDARSVER